MIGIGIAVVVLILAYILYKAFNKSAAASENGVEGNETEAASNGKVNGGIPGEVLAAISMTLYELDNDVHDIESNVLTFKRKQSTYSPWSSKIYGLTQTPNKK